MRLAGLLAVILSLSAGLAQAQDATDSEAANEATIVITGEEIDLGEAEVIGERSIAPRLSDSRALTVLGEESLQGAQSVAGVLERVPGLDVRFQGGTGQLSTPVLRGARASQVLVLLNGVPLSTGLADLSLVPLGNVASVEIVRGPEAARFGSGALGGVVNIITRGPEPAADAEAKTACACGCTAEIECGCFERDPQGSLSIGGGSHDSGSAQLTYSDHRLEFHFAHLQARNNYSFARADGSPGFRNNNEVMQDQAWAAWRSGGATHTVGFQHLGRGVPSSSEFPTPQANYRRDGLWYQAAGADWRLALTGATSRFLDPAPYPDRSEIRTRDSSWHAEFAAGALAGKVDGFGAKPRLDYISSSQYGEKMRGGLDLLQRWQGQGCGSNLELDFAAIASTDVGLDPAVRLGWSRDVSCTARVYCAAGYSVRHPAFDELYLADMGSLRGNPDLQPERVYSAELGLRTDDDCTRFELAGFYSDYRDSIIFAPVSAYSVESINTGAARIAGAELLLAQQLGDCWSWQTAATWLPLAEFASGVPLTGRAEHHVNSRLAFVRAGWHTAFELDYNGRMPADLFGSLVIPARTTATAELRREYSDGALSLRVSNMFNEPARDSWNYPLPGREIFINWEIKL